MPEFSLNLDSVSRISTKTLAYLIDQLRNDKEIGKASSAEQMITGYIIAKRLCLSAEEVIKENGIDIGNIEVWGRR